MAVDGSNSSQGAIELAKNMAKSGMAASITLISVAPIPSLPLQAMDFMISEPNQFEPIAKLVVDNARASLEKDGIEADAVVLSGDPGLQVSKYADDNQYDCILLGSRGLSVVKGIVLGSVSHKILHTAHCPVLIYRG